MAKPEPRTLYVNRPLTNADDLRAWASEQGFELMADPHVTIAFSKTPLVWPDGIPDAPDRYRNELGSRSIGRLGDEGALVLRFESPELTQRWQQIKDAGASWDYDEYLPHVTLTYEAAAPDKVEPYDGPLEFGPEVWQPVKSKEERMAVDGFYILAQDSEVPVGPFPSREVADRAAALLASPPAHLACDKDSVRVFDADGRMQVLKTPISKACVNPYLGHEIPGHEELGLDPGKVYMMFRDPEELRKGAATFNGLPILVKHEAVSASDPKREIIAGCTGTVASFEDPYLYNSLNIWTADAIEGVETNQQRELSSAYRYRPDMTPGAWEGERYDGVMRDIVGNHVALVKKGRAGPDVVVGDEAMKLQPKEIVMKKGLSRTALRLSAVLATVAAPKLAADKALDLSAVMKGVSRKSLMAADGKTFDAKKLKAIVKMARDAIDPMLTPEAQASGGIGPDDVIMKLLEMQAGPTAAEPPELDEAMPGAMPAPAEAAAGEADEMAQIMQLLQGKVDEATLAAVQKVLAKEAAPIEAAAEEGAEADGGEPPGEDEDQPSGESDAAEQSGKNPVTGDKNMVTKPAMDAAIKKAVDETRKQERAIAAAVEFVRPWVGSVSPLAFDSAEAVYRGAIEALKVEGVDEVKDPVALKAIVAAQPKPGERRAARVAMDVAPELPAGAQSLSQRFPHLDRIRVSG